MIASDKTRAEQVRHDVKVFCDTIYDLVESQNKQEYAKEEAKSFTIKPSQLSIKTDGTEGIRMQLRVHFSPMRVIVVNHEKRLDVDTVCSNLAIKYNLIYISVYQLIRQHIKNNTATGKALLATRQQKSFVQYDETINDSVEER